MAKQTDKSDSIDVKDTPECFVMMPISDCDGYDQGHFNHVYKDLIEPSCKDAGFRPTLASEVNKSNLIQLDIIQRIVEAPMAVCDLTTKNPNVMFELGIRQAFDKPVTLIKERGQSTIFDIAPLRYVEYSRNLKYHEVLNEQGKLVKSLRETFDAVGDNRNVNSIVKLLAINGGAATVPNIEGGAKEDAQLRFIMDELRQIRRLFNRNSPDKVQQKFSVEPYLDMQRLSKLMDQLVGTKLRVLKKGDVFAAQNLIKAVLKNDTLSSEDEFRLLGHLETTDDLLRVLAEQDFDE
ncbi:hypothetical protein [Maritalea porphyrae]|uniref:hypothetical protein n=1 Tax=Maritalea porphyrae TaxID=880732 RepID=UPI0022B0642F|nr:hypothetical protein [Maritalea porphyrae]MCZ4271450.1 hypothetical protein [Maritalea porphyrae]